MAEWWPRRRPGHRQKEIDAITTDEDFDVTRFEIHSDAKRWRDILKFLNHGQLLDAGCDELLAREPGSS